MDSSKPPRELKTDELYRLFEPPNGSLARREKETLRLIAEGLSEKQIAQRLDISRHTVHVYVKSLLRKSNTDSRISMVAKMLKSAASLLRGSEESDESKKRDVKS